MLNTHLYCVCLRAKALFKQQNNLPSPSTGSQYVSVCVCVFAYMCVDQWSVQSVLLNPPTSTPPLIMSAPRSLFLPFSLSCY